MSGDFNLPAFSGSPNIVHSWAASDRPSGVGAMRNNSSMARSLSASRPIARYSMARPARALVL